MSDTVSIGRKGSLGVGFESSPGTRADPTKYLPYTACTLHNVVEVLDDEAAKGIRERAWGSVAARTRGEGDITILMDVENAPYFLIPALGEIWSSTTASGESAVYEHVIRRKTGNAPKTICLNFDNTVEQREFTYGVVNTCEISFSDGFAEITAGLITKEPSSGTGSVSITEETVLAFKDAKIYFGASFTTASYNYDNNTNSKKLSAFTLTINNNSEAQYMSGDDSPAQISMGQFEVGGNYTLFFEDSTERAAHEAQTPRAMIVSFKGATIPAAGSEIEEIKIEIPEFHLTERSVDTAPAGFVTENPTFVADWNATESCSIRVTITNETDSSSYK